MSLNIRRKRQQEQKKWRIRVAERDPKMEERLTVTSEVYDSGATPNCIVNNDGFILTDEPSNKVLYIPTGTTKKSSLKSKMHHKLRYPLRTVNMVPVIKYNSLLSASKFADTNYITVLNPEEVLIYDVNDITL